MSDDYRERTFALERQVRRLLDERDELRKEIDIEKYMKRMKEAGNNGDIEVAHIDADGILCELLIELGYGKLIELYNEVDKWYA